jgi:hypothetical protein
MLKSVAILDEESLLAVCAYIDLNPVAARIEAVPEAGPTTRGGYSAKSRPQCRASWRRFLTVWARPPKAGGHGSQNQCRLFGRVLAATCDRLQEFANRMGVRRLVNLGRCPARRKERSAGTGPDPRSAARRPDGFPSTRQ